MGRWVADTSRGPPPEGHLQRANRWAAPLSPNGNQLDVKQQPGGGWVGKRGSRVRSQAGQAGQSQSAEQGRAPPACWSHFGTGILTPACQYPPQAHVLSIMPWLPRTNPRARLPARQGSRGRGRIGGGNGCKSRWRVCRLVAPAPAPAVAATGYDSGSDKRSNGSSHGCSRCRRMAAGAPAAAGGC